MTIEWTILHILLNFYDAAYYVLNINDHVESRDFVKENYKYISVVVVGILFNIINFTSNFSMISAVLFPAIVLIYVILFFKGEWYYIAFWFIFLYTILTTCDYLGTTIIMFVENAPMSLMFQDNPLRLEAIFVCRVLSSTIWFFLHRKRDEFVETSTKTLKVMIFLCFSMAVLSASVMLSETATTDYNALSEIMLPTVIALMAFTMFTFFLVASLRERRLQKSLRDFEISLEKKHIELTRSYHREIISAYKAVRKFRVDILESMKSAWPNSNSNEHNHDYIRNYLETLKNLNSVLSNELETGDSLIDIVLSVLEANAFQKGIRIEVNGILDETLSISSEDLCVIIDCLLSEAIDNVALITGDDVIKLITILFTKETKGLKVSIEHPVSDHVSFESEKLINQMIIKYDGNIKRELADMFCEVSVFLYKPDFISQSIAIMKGGIIDEKGKNDGC